MTAKDTTPAYTLAERQKAVAILRAMGAPVPAIPQPPAKHPAARPSQSWSVRVLARAFRGRARTQNLAGDPGDAARSPGPTCLACPVERVIPIGSCHRAWWHRSARKNPTA